MARSHPLARALRAIVIAMIGASAAGAATGQDWHLTVEQRERLARGEVLVYADVQASPTRGDVLAAVQIAAAAERIFRTLTDCAQALEFVPRMKLCRVLESAADGSWQFVEHAVDHGWYAPHTQYVFRAEYEPFHRIRFTHVRGDLRDNHGVWELQPAGEGESAATILTYRVHIVPRFYVPRWLVRSSLRRDLPLLLRSLRARCEGSDDSDGEDGKAR